MTACHCKDFSRSALLRSGMAQAGAGLRPIESGMPTPAGTGLSRRAFMARSGGLALAVFGGGALRPAAWEEGIAAAAAAGPQPVLVSIFMSGGVDSLSMLAPIGDAQLRGAAPDARPARQRRARGRVHRGHRGCTGIRRSPRSATCTAPAW